MAPEEYDRYSRQMVVPGIGLQGKYYFHRGYSGTVDIDMA